ncbi:MAG: hypothetical protein HKN13_10910 [Rhodothermales bacterium]|nr:hypothetical protein [Rhodothermales bacterium]
MAHETRSSDSPNHSLGDLLSLATSEPDIELLSRYAKSRSKGVNDGVALTPAETKWIETNLSCNPLWQEAWRAAQECEADLTVSHRRRLFVGTAVALSLLSTGWIVTLRDAGLSGRAQIDYAMRDIASSSKTIDAEAARLNVASVASGGWNLSLTGPLANLDSRLSALRTRYAATEDPFQKGELAYWLGNLNESAGRHRVALRWYERSVGSRSIEYQEDAISGAERMRRRTETSYQTE